MLDIPFEHLKNSNSEIQLYLLIKIAKQFPPSEAIFFHFQMEEILKITWPSFTNFFQNVIKIHKKWLKVA
jgi:hypothetical protein